ncbi:MAG: PKD domain-containing protein [Ferruginibacter sp.]
MKKTLLISYLLVLFLSVEAKHVTGGEFIYDFISATSTTRTYRITLMLFRDQACDAQQNCAQLPSTVKIGIFSRVNNQLYEDYHVVSQASISTVPIIVSPPCITNAPNLVYKVAKYSFTITLPNNASGYTAAFQTCCRRDDIDNIADNVGATYTIDIPGTNELGNSSGNNDNSPRFQPGISIICFNKPFVLDFSATDADGDLLVYNMCSGYDGGSATNAEPSYSTPPPPYLTLIYDAGYSGNFPLGQTTTINPFTGIITGTAPDAGRYVVSVCVNSYRNGVLLGTHRKDFIITVSPCDLAGVKLEPNYITCDGFNYTFENLLSSPLNLTTYWDFGDPSSPDNIATDNPHTHIFTDTGVYRIKLVVNRGNACSDSAYADVRVYPGYFPAMDNNSPRCKGSPVQFQDNTQAVYGFPNSWRWDFGDPDAINDTSNLQNPVYTYALPGTYVATLTVGSSKGCVATITDTVIILEKPPFAVTNDTLICSVDNLQLVATASATCCVTWSPNYAIDDINSFTPIVNPQVTTTYSVSYSDNLGCAVADAVTVRVVDTVTLKTGRDTTICQGDAIHLSIASDALKYIWTESPAGPTLDDPTLQSPLATPVATITTYYVTGNIGSCVDSDSIKVKTVPYPNAYAGPDQTICDGTSTSLHATGGSAYTWSPGIYLSNPGSASTTVVLPHLTMSYIVTVTDTLGCPKPVTDAVTIFVNTIVADAGPRDTSVVINQPLQLNGTGSSNFSWIGLPSTQWLNNTAIANPVAMPQDDITYVLTATDSIGCFDTDTITVHFYKVAPDLYVPTGFSPNGDGTNDILRPLALGLKSVDAFRIYNRWGQILFTTSKIGVGWNGKYGGAAQAPGTYVWYAEGTAYTGKKLFRKGTVVLIR